MGNAIRDITTLALCGLVIGLMLGVLAAGAYATWSVGGDPAGIGFGTIFAFAPWSVGYFGEPFRTALMVGGAAALAVTVATPALGFRQRPSSHGTAAWARPAELKRRGLTAPLGRRLIGPIFGKLGGPRRGAPFLTSQTDPNDPNTIAHSLLVGATGSGKGVGVIIPTLLTYKGSVICLDPKGENFEKTARARRAMGDTVYRFSPWAADRRSHRFNPLDYVVEAAPDRRYMEAKNVAASLIVAHGNGQSFVGGARDIFSAVALLVIERGTPTIGAIFDALTAGGESFDMLSRLAEEVEAPEARKTLRQYAGYENRVLSSYMSVLFDGGLGLWADPNVRASTARSDIRVEAMRQNGVSIFITVSANDLATLAPLIRLFFQQGIAILQRREPVRRKRAGALASLLGRGKPGSDALNEVYPVLFLMDEFVSLGKLDVLATAITTLRGFGGRVMIAVQSLAALRHIYGKDGASNFLGNCDFQLFMSPSDEDTPEYISKAIGDFTRSSRSRSWRSNEFRTQVQERSEGARLIRPEQVRQLGNERVLALIKNANPALVHRVTYFKDRALKRVYQGQKGALPQPPSLSSSDHRSPDPAPTRSEPEVGATAQPVKTETAGPTKAPAEVASSNEPLHLSDPAIEEHEPNAAAPEAVNAASPTEIAQEMEEQAPHSSAPEAGHIKDVAGVGPPEAELPAGLTTSDDPSPEAEAEALNPDAERTVHKNLGHLAIEQSHLHDEILGRIDLVQGKESGPEKPEAEAVWTPAETSTDGDIDPGNSAEIRPEATGGIRAAVNLSDVDRARADARKRASSESAGS